MSRIIATSVVSNPLQDKHLRGFDPLTLPPCLAYRHSRCVSPTWFFMGMVLSSFIYIFTIYIENILYYLRITYRVTLTPSTYGLGHRETLLDP